MSVLVVGNEAADADSLISAFVTSRVLSRSDSRKFLAVFQCERNDFFAMKREIVELFNFVEIFSRDSREVQISDFFDFGIFVPPGNPIPENLEISHLILTDHNEPTGAFAPLKPKVQLILDHHEVLGNDPLSSTGTEAVIQMVGSCCSIVGERFYSQLTAGEKFLLLGVILLDTHKNNKAKDLDLQVIGKISAEFGISADDQLAIGQKLKDTRDDPELWSRLTVAQKLKMDFKRFGSFAGSTVRQSIKKFLKGHQEGNGASVCLLSGADDDEESVDESGAGAPSKKGGNKQRRYDGLLEVKKFSANLPGLKLMFVLAEGKKCREILIFCDDPRILEEARKYILQAGDYFSASETTTDKLLDRIPKSLKPEISTHFSSFDLQNKTNSSRKKVAPFFSAFMKQFE